MALMKDEDIGKELEAALRRIRARENMETSILLSHVKELKDQMIELRSKKIYGTKEADLVHDGKESTYLPLVSQKTLINTEIMEINNASLVHKMVRSTLQKAAFNVQMQEAVHEKLQDLDVKEGVESSPEVRSLLEHHSRNLYTSKSLAEIIEQKEQLDVKVLQSRIQAFELLPNIMKKWNVVEGQTDIAPEEEDDEIRELRSKIESRQSKVKIIMHMLQNLISGSGILWGAKDYFVKVMLICDLIQKGTEGPLNNELMAMGKARDQKEQDSQKKPKQTEHVQYATSTPKTKSLNI